MGFGRKRAPQKSQEQIDAENAEKTRIQKEKEALDFKESENKRITTENLRGYRSLTKSEGTTGFRNKKMGTY
tara:strand:- start:889 stop:1104 length:216 start_codon:yes stop_codon:yes gene_type:complete